MWRAVDSAVRAYLWPLTGERTKPLMVVVTGPPAAGKSTLAGAVSVGLGIPSVARDQVKFSLVRTHNPTDDELRRGGPVAKRTFAAFEAVIHAYVDNGVSVVVEQACERGKGEQFLARFAPEADIAIVYCEVTREVSISRFAARLDDPSRRNVTDHEILAGLRSGAIDHSLFGRMDLPYPSVTLDCGGLDDTGWRDVHSRAVRTVEGWLQERRGGAATV